MSETFPKGLWVVVADGTQADTYRNTADNGDLTLREHVRLGPKDLADDGPAGSRPPESSPNETDEATFAKQLAQYLNKHAQAGKFDKLVLAADPQTLGQIRPSLHTTVNERLMKTLDKTLTNSPISDIERSIKAA